LKAAAKGSAAGATEFLQRVLGDGPVDQQEVMRRGKEAGYSEKSLRTAREKLGVIPKKEGFGAEGKWVWIPPGGAKVLKLVVNNNANKPPPDNKQRTADHDGGPPQCQGGHGVSPPVTDEPTTSAESEEPATNPGPDGDDVE
jgi:hypothetical protein